MEYAVVLERRRMLAVSTIFAQIMLRKIDIYHYLHKGFHFDSYLISFNTLQQ